MTRNRQHGFSLLELTIVIAIILVIGAMTAPRILRTMEFQKMQMAAQDYAGLLQTARARASQDYSWYEVQTTTANGALETYVDLNGNSRFDQGEPSIQLPAGMTVTDSGVPPGFQNGALVGTAQILNLETQPPMVNRNGAASPGIAFNERGLPCQTTVAGANCTNTTTILTGTPPAPTTGVPVAWVTYLRFPLSSGQIGWMAITVTPAGRIKVWTHQGAATGGTWQ